MTQKLAQSMVVDFRRGVVEIDGEEFPWYVSEEGPEVDYELMADWSVVRLPILVDRGNVTVITTLEQDLREIRDLGAREMAAARRWFELRHPSPVRVIERVELYDARLVSDGVGGQFLSVGFR